MNNLQSTLGIWHLHMQFLDGVYVIVSDVATTPVFRHALVSLTATQG